MQQHETQSTAPSDRPGWRFILAAGLCLVVFIFLLQIGMQHGEIVESVAVGSEAIHASQNICWFYGYQHPPNLYMPPLIFARDYGPFFDRNVVPPGFHIAKRVFAFAEKPNADSGFLLDPLNGYAPYLLEPSVSPNNYLYPAYAVTNEKEAMRLLAWMREHVQDPQLDMKDIPVEPGYGTAGTDTLYRMRMGLDATLRKAGVDAARATMAVRQVPLFIELPGHYAWNGAWVVYLDTRAKFIPYPGPFPMTKEFIEGLSEIHQGRVYNRIDAESGDPAKN